MSGARLVASLTTIPSRVHLLEASIASLWRQTRRPDRVQLNIPAESARESTPYPDESTLRASLRFPESWLTIRHGVPDEGPITKLLPTLEDERDPATIIMLADDDTAYEPHMIRVMLDHRAKHPTHKATGYSGRRARVVMKEGQSDIQLAWFSNQRRAVTVSFLENFSGGFFDRDCFPQDVDALRKELATLPPECRLNDDIVIGALLTRAKIPQTVASTEGTIRWTHDNHAPNALRDSGNLKWRNVHLYKLLSQAGYFPPPAPSLLHRLKKKFRG